MTPDTAAKVGKLLVRIGMSVAATALVVIAVVLTLWQIDRLRSRAVVSESRGATLEATSGVINDATVIDVPRLEQIAADQKAAARNRNTTREEEARDPVYRDYRNAPTDQRVLDRARERRLARERARRAQGER